MSLGAIRDQGPGEDPRETERPRRRTQWYAPISFPEARSWTSRAAAGAPALGRPSRTPAPRAAIARSAVMGLLALAILALSGRWLDQQVAVRSWLAWTLLTIWGWQVVLAGSLFFAGHAVVVRLLGIRPRSLAELLALAMPAGALAFATGLFVAGLVGCLRPAFAVVWPAGLAALALWFDRDHLTLLVGKVASPVGNRRHHGDGIPT